MEHTHVRRVVVEHTCKDGRIHTHTARKVVVEHTMYTLAIHIQSGSWSTSID